MQAKNIRIACLLVILTFVLLATLWFRMIESYYTERDMGWSQLAKRNPFHAAQLYLQKSGNDVYTTQKLEAIEKLPVSNTLFISHAGQVVSHKQVDGLIQWMSDGGHIIIAAQDDADKDPLLSRFQVERVASIEDVISALTELQQEIDIDNDNDNDADAEQYSETNKETEASAQKTQERDQAIGTDETEVADADKDCSCKEKVLTALSFDGIDHEFSVDFSDSSGLRHPYIDGENSDDDESLTEQEEFTPSYWASDENNLQFIQFNVGDGLLTVLASDTIWRNSQIGEHDHAYLLSILSNNNGQFVVLFGSLMPHISLLLWDYASELVISAACLLLLCLWYAGMRFGPIIPVQSNQRRSFNEHLLASGEYHWRMHKQDLLLQQLRDDISNTLAKKQTASITTNEADISDYLQQQTSLQEQQIHSALFAEGPWKEREFTEVVRLLQQLRGEI